MAPELTRMVANFWISRKLRLASASLPPAAAVRNSRPPLQRSWPNAGRRQRIPLDDRVGVCRTQYVVARELAVRRKLLRLRGTNPLTRTAGASTDRGSARNASRICGD